ncbi:MAG: ATP-binding protein [Planctomycetes bacterium]|nr:ATP-binding protein [Planctomycetota bacterium]
MALITIYPTEPQDFGQVILAAEIASRLEEKTPIISRILDILREERFINGDEEMQVRLCLDEAIINAMKHGNNFDEEKKVRIRVFADTYRWAIRIHDEGKGFTPEDVPDVNDPESLFLERGRGILLITEFMDQVWYYDGGRAVQLTKEKPTLGRKLARAPGKIWRKLKRWNPFG